FRSDADFALGEGQALQLLVHAAEEHQVHAGEVIVLGQVVGLCARRSETCTDGAFVHVVPGPADIEPVSWQAGEEGDAVHRTLLVAVDVVSCVAEDTKAPVVSHASKLELAEGRFVFGPSAVDGDRVLKAVDASYRRRRAGGHRADGSIATALGHGVSASGG